VRARLFAGSALALALAGAPMAAQAQTAIAPDVGVRGLGTTATLAGNVTTIDGGTLAGANLFHSFAGFSLGTGDVARWTRSAGDGASVRNVVNRVTGGTPSQIDGTLDSTALPNAAFFFINPAGIVFGAGAKVNVPAAAYFSTASQLKFADGAAFSMATPAGSTLSVAAPQAFGFVGGEGDIALNGATLSFGADASSAAFSAANIQVAGGMMLARGLDMVAVGSAGGTVALDDPLAGPLHGLLDLRGAQLVTQPIAVLGSMRLGGGTVSVDSTLLVSDAPRAVRGGDLILSGAQVSLTNGAQLSTFTRGPARGGDVRITADSFTSSGKSFAVASTASASRGGDVLLQGRVIDAGDLTLATTGADAGSSGNITIAATSSFVGDGTVLLASNVGSGGSGAITLTGPDLDLGAVIAFGSTQTGTPGDIVIHGGRVAISAGAYGSAPGVAASSGALRITGDQSLDIDGAILSAVTYDEGAAGTIALKAPRLTIRGNADIDVEVFGQGTAGSITLDGDTIRIDNAQFHADTNAASGRQIGQIRMNATGDIDLNLSFVSSDTFFGAPGGAVSIVGRNITLTESQVSSEAFRDGDAGSVSITATGTLAIHNTPVASTTGGAGNAGKVSLSAASILLENQLTAVSSDTLDAGRGGDVTIRAGSLDVENGASVVARAAAGTGDGGAVDIQVTGALRVAGDSYISADAVFGLGRAGAVKVNAGDLTVDGGGNTFTHVSSDTYGPGNAGGVTVTANTINVINGGAISSNALSGSEGNAGTVAINAGTLTVRNGGGVSSDTESDGHAGNVQVVADTIVVDGGLDASLTTAISSTSIFAGDAGTVNIDAKTLKVMGYGFISSDTLDVGKGGDVKVHAGAITLDSGDIRSSTLTQGDAGDVTVNATTVTLDHAATIGSDAFSGSTGHAGIVNLTAGSLTIGKDSRVSTATGGRGDAGTVTVAAQTLTLNGGFILSSSVPGGRGGSGNLVLTAGAVNVLGGGQISTASNNPHTAGQVQLSADTVLVSGVGSSIGSENQAGNTKLFNRAGEAGDAGSVQIGAHGLTVAEGGSISTNSYAGAAGDIRIDIPRPGLLVLQGATAPGVIQTSSGPGKGGRIVISDPLAIISNGGSLLALGQQHGANVVIQSRYFINSTDRTNTVAVDGDIHLETGLYDVSSGTVSRDLSVLDASKVLRGQCPTTRSTGVVSQLVSRPVGPYVREPALGVAPAVAAQPRACR